MAACPGANEDHAPRKISHSAQVIEDPKEDGGEGEGQPQSSKWRTFNLLRWQRVPPVPSQRQASPEYGASILSLILFNWVDPFVKVGYLREVDVRDIWLVNPKRSTDVLTNKLEFALRRRLDAGGQKPLYWALYDVFKMEIWTSTLCQTVAVTGSLMAPFLSRSLIAFTMEVYSARKNGDPTPNIGPAMGYAVGIFLLTALSTLCTNHAFYWGTMAGHQMKTTLTSMIFSKTMRLSSRARIGASDSHEGKEGMLSANVEKGWSNGRIVALMGVDLERIDRSCATLHIIGAMIAALIIALIVLVVIIGYSALSGYGYVLIMLFWTGSAMKYSVRARRRLNKITDRRVSLTQEILQNVRFMKFFGWESSFLDRFSAIRAQEIGSLHKVLMVKHTIIIASMSISALSSMLSFITYALTGHSLTPDRIFASLAAFNALRTPFSIANMSLGQAADAWEGVGRVQSFLTAEEREEYMEWDFEMKNAISLERASFTWEAAPPNTEDDMSRPGTRAAATSPNASSPSNDGGGEVFKLLDLNLRLGRGELVAVIGAVGCGKSSLLGALASNMRLMSGKALMGASRAFCPQTAWIQNASVRDNIVFGQDYDEYRYNQVITACALRSDFAMLPDGDLTEVGERGITLSGGQKQRVNIARAVYSNSEIILMDDPLSAVDAHVGHQLMEEVVCGLLKDRCRVLATHQLHVLGRCDRIIVMDQGQVLAIDTFDNLMKTNELFQRLMCSITTDEEGSRELPATKEVGEVHTEVTGEAVKTSTQKTTLMQKEERATGSVGWAVWKTYIKSSGSFLNLFVSIMLAVLSVGCLVMAGLWLSFWTSNKFPTLSVTQNAGIYAGISMAQVILLYLFALHMNIAGSLSSNNMLKRAMHRVLRAPVSFFDTTPLGRITNRFSKDVAVLDEDLADCLRVFVFALFNIIGTAALAIAFFHYFAIIAAVVAVFTMFLVSYYRPASRGLRRHEAVLRSVVFARFSEAIIGSSSIQAYNMEAHFQRSLHETLDSMAGATLLSAADQRWICVRTDLSCTLLILAVACLVASCEFDVTPSVSGLVLSYILTISGLLTVCIRQFGQAQSGMNSVERLHHYGAYLEQEPPLHQSEVPPSWPEKGRITFTDAQMRYRDGLPLVLRGLSMDIRGGERIGIVGRTGAGKSSIMATLFRFVELCGGTIKIDDIDISTVGVRDLRTRLAIIPQDPTLFKGTIRSNLDPFDEHSDLEMWSALRKAHLVGHELSEESSGDSDGTNEGSTSGQPKRLHLDTSVEEDGANFSLGQRQLMALARALVRDSRIIICDEATSSVDLETDTKVQETMARGFHGKTLLCIAHRLRTIINYDRICVMDQGRIAEMDTPLKLWERPGSVFRGMCDSSGITREDFDQ